MEFYSHPNKPVICHLKEVYDGMVLLDGEDDSFKKMLSLGHDFGKYTSYFQKYLINHNKTKLTNHGFISALFTSFIAFKEFGGDSCLPLFSYIIVLKHHGNLDNISNDLPVKLIDITNKDRVLKDKIEDAKTQIEDMKKNKSRIVNDYKEFGYGKYVEEFLDNFNIDEHIKALNRFYYHNIKKVKLGLCENYFKINYYYSLLICADKFSASDTPIINKKSAEFKFLSEAKNKLIGGSKSGINVIRQEIFDKVQKSINKSYKGKNIFSITAPTGTGKTFTGFFAALRLKELLGDSRKIVYSLPFTSIIDQNYEVLCEVIKLAASDFDLCGSQYIIKHHSLANVEYVADKKEYKNPDLLKSQMLIDSWNSGIVVTTFVQLLETIISNNNKMLKKFNSIRHSILLLDEVQAIDIKYLGLIDYILKAAVKYLDCKIIIMTATKPIILTEANELLEDYKTYFGKFNRTALRFHAEKVTVEEVADKFCDNAVDKSYLIVCNTIKESKKLYKLIKHKLPDRKIYYLSTNLLPYHRMKNISEIKEMLKRGEKPIVISTQVIEAGVDLDFNKVIRDIGPIDSIIQCAGRQNRNGLEAMEAVEIVQIVDEKNKLYGEKIYGSTQINITRELLNKYGDITEKDYLPMIEEYYIKVNENKSKDTSKLFINSIENLFYSEGNDKHAVKDFSLIENRDDNIDVFFRINDEAEEIYRKFEEGIKEKDINLKKAKMLEIRPELAKYTMSIPLKYFRKINCYENEVLLSITRDGCEVLYDNETGFIRDDGEEFMIF